MNTPNQEPLKIYESPFPLEPTEHKYDLGTPCHPIPNNVYVGGDAPSQVTVICGKKGEEILFIRTPFSLDSIMSDALARMEANARKAIAEALPSLKIGPVVVEANRNNCGGQVQYSPIIFFSICVFKEDGRIMIGGVNELTIDEAIASAVKKLTAMPTP